MASQNAEDGGESGKEKAPNATQHEKTILMALIEERKKIIEDKRHGFQIFTQKQNAWKEITTAFNAEGTTTKRSEEQIRRMWDNMKQAAKKKVTAHRKSVRKTGGGSGPAALPPDVERISSIIPEQLNPLRNPYDCDAELELDKDDTVIVDVSNKTPEPEHSTNSDNQVASGADDENAKPKSKKSKDPRSMLVEYEGDEHIIRMKNLNIQTEIFKMELTIKKRSLEMMEEEHAKKMKILDMKLYD